MRGRSHLANDAWESLLRVHAVFMKSFAAEPIWGEVSMKEYDVLYALAKAAGPLRVTDLHREVLLSQPALSRLLDRLVHRGFLARSPDPRDHRVVRLALTGAGKAAQRKVGRSHARHVAQAMTASGVSNADLETLERIARSLSARYEIG